MNLARLEWWAYGLGWAAVLFTFLGAAAGIVSWHFTNRANAMKDESLARFQAESNTRIAEAEAKTAAALQGAAEANEKAEAEHLARLKIERSLAPRVLADDQLAAIVATARQFAGQRFQVSTFPGDTECLDLATKIHFALLEAGWSGPTQRPLVGWLLLAEVGVDVGVSANAEPRAVAAADALSAALNRAGLRSTRIISGDDPAFVAIRVGTKA